MNEPPAKKFARWEGRYWCCRCCSARRNYRLGRGDREGAIRLAFVMFGLEIALWMCRSHLVPGLETFFLLLIALSTGLLVSGTTWLLYLAVEPWVRRNWPQTIISWSRLLAGQ